MERRKFLIGAGSAAVGSSALIGSGAFTSVQAERDITVEVADDADAFLGIEPHSGSNGEYATAEGGTVSLDFTETEAADGSTGLNDQAKVNIENVLQITNNGTEDVYVTVKVEDADGNTGREVAGLSEFGISGDDDVDFARTAGSYDGDKLPTGESAGMGFYFNWNGENNFGEIVNNIEKIWIVSAASKDELERFKPTSE